ncbi:RDD family protein [Planctomycetota bacterium]
MNTSTTIPSMPVITLDTLLKQCMSEFDISEESESQEANTEQVAEVVQPARQVRPWVRYFARIVDLFLFSLLAGFVLGMFAPSVLDLPSALLTVAILFVWIFQEAIFLANCGTTPGKWFFRIKVRNSRGQKLTFSEALNRSFGVWLKGMGAGVPLLNLITLLGSRSKLKRDGITAWDEDGGFVVTHGKVGILRSAVVTVLLLGFYCFGTVGNTFEERADFELTSNSVAAQEPLVKPAKSTVTGRHGTYSIKYDPSTWVLKSKMSNTDAEYEFHHDNGDAYAMLIYERTQIPLNVLEAAAIENLKSTASDVKVLSRETIQLDGQPVLSMQCEATIMTVPFVYHTYLSSSEQGTLQFVTFTSKYLFNEYRSDCNALLCGLNLSSSESQTPNDTDLAVSAREEVKPAVVRVKADNDDESDFQKLIGFAEKWLEN